MRLLARLLEPRTVAHAHCDLPCGVYDPAQARIEAESVKAISEKYQQNTDPEFRARAIYIKEQRSELVKHHLWVLWTDYFKPPHFEKYPNLHTLFNEATKLAGASGTKGSADPAKADELLARIEAESVKAITEKYAQNTDPEFRTRAILIKEQRSELVKHHLWVLWTDYFKPPHFEKYPQLNTLFNEATKLAGAGGTKGSVDVEVADRLLAKIEEISKIFWETKQA